MLKNKVLLSTFSDMTWTQQKTSGQQSKQESVSAMIKKYEMGYNNWNVVITVCFK